MFSYVYHNSVNPGETAGLVPVRGLKIICLLLRMLKLYTRRCTSLVLRTPSSCITHTSGSSSETPGKWRLAHGKQTHTRVQRLAVRNKHCVNIQQPGKDLSLCCKNDCPLVYSKLMSIACPNCTKCVIALPRADRNTPTECGVYGLTDGDALIHGEMLLQRLLILFGLFSADEELCNRGELRQSHICSRICTPLFLRLPWSHGEPLRWVKPV